MKIQKIAAVAALALTVASGAAMAASSAYPQTWSQQAADLRNPNNTTYVPLHKGE